MAKDTSSVTRTIGLDLGDRHSHFCSLDPSGEVEQQGRLRTTREALARLFEGRERCRVVLEAGSQSAWVAEQLEAWGHEVLVANPRQLAAIYAQPTKSDAIDAETLARLGRADPKLLRPIRPRRPGTLADRAVLRSRALAVRCRTQLINHVRGTVKALGARLPACSTTAFARRVRGELPEALRPALEPVLDLIQQLSDQVRAYDGQIERLGAERYPETALLRQVPGVGATTALAFVLTIEDPLRFPRSRIVGSYLGLRPRRDQSGARDPQMRITKAGDRELRRLLVQAAQYQLGPFGPDTDLRRFGQRLAARGGKAARKRAVVAVARKTAVLLHRLWVTGAVYEPLYHSARPVD